MFNILLQVLEDGRLTDGQGRTVDFRNSLIIMTSNLGSQIIQNMRSEEYNEMKNSVMEIVSNYFRPEFINRIDENVVFHSLNRDHISSIIDIQLAQLYDRLSSRDIKIILSDDARDKIVEAGYDPSYGARPLKRAIQQMVQNPLALEILNGSFISGDIIKIDVKDDHLDFKKAA